MKKLKFLVLALLFFCFCVPRGEKVEKIIEDGVEVIINHLEPYKIKGESSNLVLEEEFTIDTEKEQMAEIGLTSIDSFDVDSEGNIYLSNQHSPEYFIFKFDKNGNFVMRFGRKGQGPGEIQFPTSMSTAENDEIVMVDQMQLKIITFSNNGSFIKEARVDFDTPWIKPLANGNYLIYRYHYKENPEDNYYQDLFLLYNPDFEKIKELDRYIPYSQKIKKLRTFRTATISTASKKNIYLANEERSYEIWVFDLEGNLKRKIRKEYKQVLINEEYKNKFRKWLERTKQSRDRYYFPKFFPPYQLGFSDEEGRLFVMTYEEGNTPTEYMYDIFNPDGIFTARTSLGNYGTIPGGLPVALFAKAKNSRIYCSREKESGYRELVVYRMIWK